MTLYTFFCLLGWLFFYREGNPFYTLCLLDGILLILYLAELFIILAFVYFVGYFIVNC
nr:MAG TPA: hypothetical protein [Caudoviricetes sp.]